MSDNGRLHGEPMGERPVDDRLALAIASGASVRDAAQGAGVSERTAHRRLADPDFVRLVSLFRREMTTQALGMLTAASTEAATTVRSLLASNNETVRLGAVRTILDARTKLAEHTEIVERIERLEEQLAATTLTQGTR